MLWQHMRSFRLRWSYTLCIWRHSPSQILNLYAYGCDLIREDNAVLSPYGLLHRADYQPMLSPMQETQKMEMKMK